MNLKARHASVQDLLRARGPTSSASARSGPSASSAYGGPFLFGAPTVADAMYAPVCTRFRTYAVPLDARLAGAIATTIFAWPLMQEWTEGALAEPDEIVELEVEF